MPRAIPVRALFLARISLVVAASLFGIFALCAQRNAQSAVGDTPTVRYPVTAAELSDPATHRFAVMIDDLNNKIAPLEASAQEARLLASLSDKPWLLYLALFTPLTAALLQAAERYLEDRHR